MSGRCWRRRDDHIEYLGQNGALLTLSKREDSAGERVFWSSNPTPHRSEVLVVEFRDFGEEISQHNQPVYVPL